MTPVAQEEPLTPRLPTEGSFPIVSMEFLIYWLWSKWQTVSGYGPVFPASLNSQMHLNHGSGICHCQSQSSYSQMMRATYAHVIGLATGDASVGLG